MYPIKPRFERTVKAQTLLTGESVAVITSWRFRFFYTSMYSVPRRSLGTRNEGVIASETKQSLLYLLGANHLAYIAS